MTPERLQFIIDHSRQRGAALTTYRRIARFLNVDPITLRRWRRGQERIPRMAEIIFEIHHAYPEINSITIQRLIDERDAAERERKAT